MRRERGPAPAACGIFKIALPRARQLGTYRTCPLHPSRHFHRHVRASSACGQTTGQHTAARAREIQGESMFVQTDEPRPRMRLVHPCAVCVCDAAGLPSVERRFPACPGFLLFFFFLSPSFLFVRVQVRTDSDESLTAASRPLSPAHETGRNVCGGWRPPIVGGYGAAVGLFPAPCVPPC